MRRLVLLTTAMTAAMALLAGGALAHHSGAMFDRLKTVELKGVVKEYQYISPHAWIRLMVQDGRKPPVEWGIEGGGAGLMRNWGIIPQRLKAGDRISLRMHPLKDGRTGGALVDITLADGTLVRTFTSHQQVGKPRF
ncbi:MAG: DUF6152 family protein [Caulobacteraceae bacterium]